MPEFHVPAHPGATSEEMSARMSSYPRKDTKPEKALRSELHRRGLRYRVQHPVPGRSRRTIDVAFTKVKLAVFVDGCFWHRCPEHGVVPKSSTAWWEEKLEANRQRDRDTDEALAAAGWSVLRFWEHEDRSVAAEKVWWALRPGASGGPGDDYLHDVGQIAWQVSTLEWLVLGELPGMGLGAELLDLEGKSTGTMARSLDELCEGMGPGPERDYLEEAAASLRAVAAVRNDLLHARPATHPVEGQRLLRSEQGRGRKPTGRRFWIDTDWLDGARLMTGSHVRWLDRKRAKMREASEESGSTA